MQSQNFLNFKTYGTYMSKPGRKCTFFQAKYPKRYFKQLNLSEENPIDLFQKTYSHHLKTAI